MKIIRYAFLLCLIPFVAGAGEYPPKDVSPEFRSYWFDRGAEISKYDLKQARYGEIHEGHAVLIFVTEPFNTVTQVKSDHAQAADAVPVLKLNTTRKFLTGVYPYSTMTSVFTPLETSKVSTPLKITTSVQEWCGHVWMQMNQRDAAYEVQSFSYFESEGDQKFTLPNVVSEDGLWMQLRLAPDRLPVGEFDIIPGTLHTRLKHSPFKVMQAEGRFETRGDLLVYHLKIAELGREVEIQFGRAFPHRIEFWRERYTSGWGAGAKVLETTATRTHTIFSPYWGKHNNADRALRKELGL